MVNFFKKSSSKASNVYLLLTIKALGKMLALSSLNNINIKEEISEFRNDAKILFKINYIKDAYFVLEVEGDVFKLIDEKEQAITEYDLAIMIKHPKLALKILTFQESNTIAVAHNRFVTSGDASLGIRFINCLEILEAHLLPNFISKKILAKHEEISIKQKIKFIKQLIC